jgi:hypothetical protein
MARRFNPWVRVAMDAWSLGLEASSVIGLRTMKLTAGGAAADAESRRMVAEKIDAGFELQAKALSGALGFSAPVMAANTLSHYRQKVRANRRRLAKK